MRVHSLTGLLAAAGVAVLLALWSTPTRAAWDPLELFVPSEKVGVVEITGVISRSTPILEDLKKFREDHSIRAIVVRINSPGGAVGPSQEIMEEINKTKKEKKKIPARLLPKKYRTQDGLEIWVGGEQGRDWDLYFSVYLEALGMKFQWPSVACIPK